VRSDQAAGSVMHQHQIGVAHAKRPRLAALKNTVRRRVAPPQSWRTEIAGQCAPLRPRKVIQA
jgi:hypothetical protein